MINIMFVITIAILIYILIRSIKRNRDSDKEIAMYKRVNERFWKDQNKLRGKKDG